jgi:hypothetical protein
MVTNLGDAERFVQRAREFRVVADQIDDPNSRDVIIRAAEDYERRAARIRSGLQSRNR